jgi:hypothetical protein
MNVALHRRAICYHVRQWSVSLSQQAQCQGSVIGAFHIAFHEQGAVLTQSADIAPDKVHIGALNLLI